VAAPAFSAAALSVKVAVSLASAADLLAVSVRAAAVDSTALPLRGAPGPQR
jgi:hypothetical protein